MFCCLSADARLARVSLGKQFKTAQEPMDVYNQLTRLCESEKNDNRTIALSGAITTH